MKQCPQCKFKNDSLRKSCGACGARLDGKDQVVSRSASAGRVRSPALLDASDEHQILGLLRDSRKIEAIKLYREATGGGLKDAKEAVEKLARANGIQMHQSVSGFGCAVALALLTVLVWFFVFQ